VAKSNLQLRNFNKSAAPSHAQGMTGAMAFYPHSGPYNAPPGASSAGADLVKELSDQLRLGLEEKYVDKEKQADAEPSRGGTGPSTMPGSRQPVESAGPS
jgi:hypothetical protein